MITAKQFFEAQLSGEPLHQTVVTDSLIRFAQLHVRAALQEASKRAYCDMIHPPDDDYPELEESETVVVKESILNAYPLTNIV